jgi:hypothetical protein
LRTGLGVVARILIERPKAVWRDRVRLYSVELDGARVGQIAPGSELALEVTPGLHRLKARIDWTGSREISVDVADGSDVRLTVKPAGNSLQMYQALTKGRYLKLQHSGVS